VIEALIAEPHGYRERTDAQVAHDDDGLIGVEFRVGPAGDVAHGHQDGVGKMCSLELPGVTDVQQERGIGLISELLEGFGSDLGVEHEISIIDSYNFMGSARGWIINRIGGGAANVDAM
jgi:hypothetical protein